jgi:hypothetical protein
MGIDTKELKKNQKNQREDTVFQCGHSTQLSRKRTSLDYLEF